MSKRQKFTPEFRAEAVELVISTQRSLVEAAEPLGIDEGTWGNWVQAFCAEHPGGENEERGPVEWAQYEKLRKELAEARADSRDRLFYVCQAVSWTFFV